MLNRRQALSTISSSVFLGVVGGISRVNATDSLDVGGGTLLAAERNTEPLSFDSRSRISLGHIQAIGFDSLNALLIVELKIGEPSRLATRTVVMKTTDGGKTWKKTLVAGGGSFNPTEIVVYERNIWFITQWQIEGTYPTLYFTNNFGDTWNESNSINDFLSNKTGVNAVNFARDLRFRDGKSGYVIAQGLDRSGKDKPFFLMTSDSGKTWKEISNFPSEYFTDSQDGSNWNFRNEWTASEKNSTIIVSRPSTVSWRDLIE
jgi:photosystem II stability/assembly factor-like uncharacterized protein